MLDSTDGNVPVTLNITTTSEEQTLGKRYSSSISGVENYID